ncbi:MAG: serine/threonine protein kinase, partial [Planctomycetota bacterium]
MSARATVKVRVGARLGEYTLLGLLGRGAMGEVWLGEGPEGRVALKLLRETLSEESDAARRFAREIEILASLDHPGIVRARSGLEREGDLHYYAMELVLGRNLQAVLDAAGALRPAHAVDLTCELLDALQAAHDAGVVHRDVKPANVLIDREGRARLTDFGLARADGRSHLTLAEVVLGTPAYMSPEQARGLEAGPASDLYSTGAVLFQLLCGRPPFTAERPLALLRAHSDEAPPDPATLCPGLPAPLAEVVLRALAKEPERRYASAVAMREALLRVRPTDDEESASTLVLKARVEELGLETDALATKPPAEIPGYRLLRPLGAGGEGQVYLAESTDGLGKKVALKVYLGQAAQRFAGELAAYRRLEEARATSGCPYLAEGLAAGELEGGGGYLALDYQEGGTLADRVRESGPLPSDAAGALLAQVLSGLEALHAAGLCHRDVKPHNVLVGRDGRARLGDFGLAKETDAALSTGGTPAFAAPEQFPTPAGEDARERDGVAIDVYGAGATLYYLLTGRPPLPGAPDVFQLEAKLVPRALQRVVLRALSRDPTERFAT